MSQYFLNIQCVIHPENRINNFKLKMMDYKIEFRIKVGAESGSDFFSAKPDRRGKHRILIPK